MPKFLNKAIIFSGISLFSLFNTRIVSAQIVPDNTLGAESSTTKNINELRSRIEGGAIRGENLFHSFKEFSIKEGLEVYFANPEQISNIFSRVTGSNVSEIFGTLGVDGAANLFLINPNGIIFGENAVINISGSLIATTAESINFEDGSTWKIRDRSSQPILTWNAPIGLGLDNPKSIKVLGDGNNLEIPIPEFNIIRDNRPTGIAVKQNNSINLIGGEIILEGGNLTAPGGRIELGSIKGKQTVGLTSIGTNWQFNYAKVDSFSDIRLIQEASIDVSGEKGGHVSLYGQNIKIKDGSAILANTLTNTTGGDITIESDSLIMSGANKNNFVNAIATDSIGGTGGNIDLKTSQLYLSDGSQIRSVVFGDGVTGNIDITAKDITVTGVNSLNFDYLTSIETSIATESIGGTGKDVNINTENLLVSGGGRILTDTFGIGNAGNIFVNANTIELIEFKNRDLGLLTGLSSATRIESKKGNAGNIYIEAESLKLINGAGIRGNTLSLGNGGNIFIDVSHIEISGISPFDSTTRSRISTNTFDEGDGGRIIVDSKYLNLTNSGSIQARTFGDGRGGDITINSDILNIENKSRVDASAFRNGNGGDITINSDILNITGNSVISSTTYERSGDSGNIFIESASLILDNSIISASTFTNGTGGKIEIFSQNKIIIDSNSQIITRATNTGNAGNILLKTNFLEVFNDSQINSSLDSKDITKKAGTIEVEAENIIIQNSLFTVTSSGKGGNIFINSDRLVFDNSQVTAFAEGEGNGGNITIDTDGLIGIDSNITATAVRGNGGRINITAAGLLGFESESLNIDASSEFGQDGSITIINPQINNRDPVFEFVNLEVEKNENNLDNSCEEDSNKTLIYTGRARLNPSIQSLSSEEVYLPAPGFVPPEESNPKIEDSPWQEGDPIIDSNAVRIDKQGNIAFVAELSPKTARELLCKKEAKINRQSD